jgi:hypothetical protein
MTATPNLETSIQGAKGSGQPLDENIRQPMEKAFGGVDFSQVKVHDDTQSDQLNKSIQARAFTTGTDVFFRGGEYNPGSRAGGFHFLNSSRRKSETFTIIRSFFR